MVVDDLIVEVADLPPPPTRRWVVPGIIPAARVSMFFGPAESAKTTVAIDLAMAVASGGYWLGRQVLQGRVWWVDFDEDVDEFNWKVRASAQGRLMGDVPAGLTYIPASVPLVDLLPDLWKLRDEYSPELIIVDSFNSALGGNSERAEVVLPVLFAMRGVGSIWLPIDHETKLSGNAKPLDPRMPFGSQVKAAQARSLVSFARPSPGEYPNSVVLVHQKSSYARRSEPMAIQVKRDSGGVWVELVGWDEPPFDTVPERGKKSEAPDKSKATGKPKSRRKRSAA